MCINYISLQNCPPGKFYYHQRNTAVQVFVTSIQNMRFTIFFFWMLIINHLVGSSLSCLINQPNLQPHLADSVWKLSVRSNDLLPIKGRRSGWTEFLEKNSLQATAYLLSGRPRLHIWILFYMSCISSSQYTCWTGPDCILEIAIKRTATAPGSHVNLPNQQPDLIVCQTDDDDNEIKL